MGFDERDILLIRELQKEIYLQPEPFKAVADSLGRPVEDVLERIKELKERGVIRRFGAALTPAKAGFRINAMVVWDVKDADGNATGEKMAAHPRISHCYIRPSFQGFPYTLYTMMHANSAEELMEIIEGLRAESGLDSFKILKTVKELKKTSPVYF